MSWRVLRFLVQVCGAVGRIGSSLGSGTLAPKWDEISFRLARRNDMAISFAGAFVFCGMVSRQSSSPGVGSRSPGRHQHSSASASRVQLGKTGRHRIGEQVS